MRGTLPRELGTYRIIRPSEFTPEQLEVLRRAGEERVVERLAALLTKGVPASSAQRFFSAYRRSVATGRVN